MQLYRNLKVSSAFTLVELLVVIAIIGLLATLLIVNINAARGRARDATRKSDLRNIQTALRFYYNDFGEYPNNSGTSIAGCGTGSTVCAWGEEAFETGEQPYMNLLPADPSPDRQYQYNRDDTATDLYTLKACLENRSDDKCGTAESWCDTDLEGCIYLVQP